MKLNNKVAEQACETMLSKKPWQTPEVIVLSSDDTEFGPTGVPIDGFGAAAPTTS